MTSAVAATHLTLAHGTDVAVDDATFTIEVGTHAVLIGPNASGKSTLLRAIAGLMSARGGHLVVPAAERRGGVAIVLQTPHLDPTLPVTVAETVAMGRYPHRHPLMPLQRSDKQIVAEAMARMEVADLAHELLSDLSGGQRQRVLVAQGLAQEADLLLLDEPTTALDLPSQHTVADAIDAEVRAGRTVISSTHEFAEARRADQVLLLARRLVSAGPPASALRDACLREAYGGRVVATEAGHVLLDDPHHAH